MKKMNSILIMTVAVLVASTAAGAFAQATPPAEPALLSDGIGAKYKRFDNMHQTRYIELILAGREAKSGNVVAAVYNTMLTDKGIPASRDSAPQALVEQLDLAKIKQEEALLGANLNGPKLWQPDWMEIDQGKERTFAGMPMAWVAQLNVPAKGGIGIDQAYKPMTIARKSGVGWNNGTTVMLLDDAEGNTWV